MRTNIQIAIKSNIPNGRSPSLPSFAIHMTCILYFFPFLSIRTYYQSSWLFLVFLSLVIWIFFFEKFDHFYAMEILTKYPNKAYTEPLSEMYSRKINFNAIHFVKSNNNKNFIKTHECWVLCVFVCSLQRFKNWITNRSLSTKPFPSIDAVFCCCNVFFPHFCFFYQWDFYGNI